MAASSPTFWRRSGSQAGSSPSLLSLTAQRPLFLHLSRVAGPGPRGSPRRQEPLCPGGAAGAGRTVAPGRQRGPGGLLRPHTRPRPRHQRRSQPARGPRHPPRTQSPGEGHPAEVAPLTGAGPSLPRRPPCAPWVPLVPSAPPPPPPQGAWDPRSSLSSAPRTFRAKGRRREGWWDTGFPKQTPGARGQGQGRTRGCCRGAAGPAGRPGADQRPSPRSPLGSRLGSQKPGRGAGSQAGAAPGGDQEPPAPPSPHRRTAAFVLGCDFPPARHRPPSVPLLPFPIPRGPHGPGPLSREPGAQGCVPRLYWGAGGGWRLPPTRRPEARLGRPDPGGQWGPEQTVPRREPEARNGCSARSRQKPMHKG